MRRLPPIILCLSVLALAGGAHAADFVAAPLSGGEEVPANASTARGVATFDLSDDGSRIDFQLAASNIENVTMAHIHLGPAGANGSIVAFLFGPVAAGGGRQNGILATGTITAADLTGPLAGQPLSALLDAMGSSGAYVNVHTNDGIDPSNSGPGDFPAGEIRGQIRVGDSD